MEETYEVPKADFVEFKIPESKSELNIGGNMGITFQLPMEFPNWWWRMWQYLIFGFKWRKL